MKRRLGILTGGGDCPGLNAAIRAVVKHATQSYGYEVIGIKEAFRGLYEGKMIPLTRDMVRGIHHRGGTILGSSNRANPFAYPIVRDGVEHIEDVSDACLAQWKEWGAEGLIVVGGDGTQDIAHRMLAKGLNVVGIPKTIDNDLEATECTIGYQTAVDVVCEALGRLSSTAESHDRIMICEVMGRYAGWIALNAGIASGVEVVLIPEQDYDVERVIDSLRRRHDSGISFSVIVIAEGSKPKGQGHAVIEEGDAAELERLGGAGARLAAQITARTNFEVRNTVLGHVQRGGTPAPFDQLLAARFGVAAVDLAHEQKWGRVAAMRGGQVVDVPMEQAVAKMKRVDPTGPLVKTARSLGIELGF